MHDVSPPSLPESFDPKARDDLRRVPIRDQADRDPISSRLMRYRDQKVRAGPTYRPPNAMYPEARRRLVRLLGEVDAASP